MKKLSRKLIAGFLLVALITGIVLKAAGTIAAVAIAHKVFAALFVVLLVVLLFVRKVTAKKA